MCVCVCVSHTYIPSIIILIILSHPNLLSVYMMSAVELEGVSLIFTIYLEETGSGTADDDSCSIIIEENIKI